MTLKQQLTHFQLASQDRILNLFKQSHARVGLGHTGGHIKMNDWLNFQEGFAQAKDAVFSQFDFEKVNAFCHSLKLETFHADSQATDPTQFLLRPDLGRLLSSDTHYMLEQLNINAGYDLLLVISGGLSPLAIQHQIFSFLPNFLNNIPQHWKLAPVIITPRSRVALGDQLNHYFKAKLTVMLIGERPGLTTPDSMGIYITFNAKPGCTDEQRNCISNIHAHGLSYADAADKLTALLKMALKNQFTGISFEKTTAQIL